MQVTSIFRMLGVLLMILSISFVPPILVAYGYEESHFSVFSYSFAITLGVGAIFWFLCRTKKMPLRTHEGFLIVALFWLTASIIGALPFYWGVPEISLVDAFFESVSGITTTGSTIFTNLDNLPHSMLYYRQQLQFLGGISIVLLAVAIIPTLGIGGMQLFRTEMTGPVKDDKLTPRITYTAKATWLIYLGMTILCAVCYWLAGMSWFDAISHSFSTVSTGGFSTHNTSLAYFNNFAINVIAIIFMLLGAISFNLHFLLLKRKTIAVYTQDPEFRFFFRILFSFWVIVWITLSIQGNPERTSFIEPLFQVVSSLTTTGFAMSGFSGTAFIPILLLFSGMIGGCAGSTSGGVKTVRILLLQKLGGREILRLIHPHGQYVIKLGPKPINSRVIEALWGFFVIYVVVFTLLLLLLLIVEQDFYSTYSALIATFSNTGRGLGSLTQHFSGLSDYAKWILSFAMLTGRLEVFTILVLLSSAFWRR